MLRDWIYSSSLNRRMWVSFTLLIVFCISATGLFSYSTASRAMEKNARALNQNVLNKSVDVLDQKLKQIIVASSTLMLSEAYKQTIRDIQAKKRERHYTNFSLLQVPFAQAELTEKSIDSILISTPAGDYYPTTKSRRPNAAFQDTALYRHMKENPDSEWVTSHEDELFTSGNRVISLLLQPLTDYYVPDVFLAVNVDEEMILDVIREDVANEATRFLLLDKSGGSVLSASDRPAWTKEPAFLRLIAAEPSGDFEYPSDGGPMLVNFAQSEYAEDWILVSYLSKERLLEPVQTIKWLMLTIMAGCITLALLLARYLSHLLLKPLHLLRKTMKQVENNDLTARFESPYRDEIGDAGRQFNRMLGTIQELIQEVLDTEKEKRIAEIKALQAQIDPHFLYNTLNTIFWKCEMDEYEDVKEMVISLSALFRLGLNNGQEMTTLGKELEHVRQYLQIQKQCYETLFDYEIEADPGDFELPVLKVVLQPLVENSILHGMKALKKPGCILVKAERTEGLLLLLVRDNGVGMDAEALEARLTEPSGSNSGYALKNVRSRLLLYYGTEANIAFRSEPYVHTEVTISIPIEGGEKA